MTEESQLTPDLKDIWHLDYRKNHQPCSINFEFKGTFAEVHARVKVYCERMGFKAPYVRPFLTDLDQEEKRLNG